MTKVTKIFVRRVNMRIKSILASASVLIISSTMSLAATLNIDASGQLLGASGIEVEGGFFNVEFVDGSCIEVFDGCDSDSDSLLTFKTEEAATAATQALSDQVFVDVAEGEFDTNPLLTNGCVGGSVCNIITIYSIFDSDVFIARMDAVGFRNRSGDDSIFSVPLAQDEGGEPDLTWAVWEPAVVPLPAGLPLLITGLAGMAIIRNRKRGMSKPKMCQGRRMPQGHLP